MLQQQKHKYKAKASDGFPSKLERAVYEMLVLRERSGEIRDIKRQQTVMLPAGISWRVDFSFVDKQSDKRVYCEAKGVQTPEFRIKLKLYKHFIYEPLEIWGGHWRKPSLIESINFAPK